jgi:hypothetical protein
MHRKNFYDVQRIQVKREERCQVLIPYLGFSLLSLLAQKSKFGVAENEQLTGLISMMMMMMMNKMMMKKMMTN